MAGWSPAWPDCRLTAATLWVCAALSDTDREVAAAAPDGRLDLAGYGTGGAVRMLPIDAPTLAGAYTAISNTTLWYLHHGLSTGQPAGRSTTHGVATGRSYVAYNSAFADAIAEESATARRVLAQDYHLTLLPAMLRARRAGPADQPVHPHAVGGAGGLRPAARTTSRPSC